jgi:hypothetical protein
MNERIDKLIEQCTVQNFSDCIGGYETFDKEKFAELIIRECASISSQFSLENKRFHPDIDPANLEVGCRMVYFSTCWAVANEIKEHFGVE